MNQYTDPEFGDLMRNAHPGLYDEYWTDDEIIKDRYAIDPDGTKKVLISANNNPNWPYAPDYKAPDPNENYDPSLMDDVRWSVNKWKEAILHGPPEYLLTANEALKRWQFESLEGSREQLVESQMMMEWNHLRYEDPTLTAETPMFSAEKIENFFRKHELFGYKGKAPSSFYTEKNIYSPTEEAKRTFREREGIPSNVSLISKESLANIEKHVSELETDKYSAYQDAMIQTQDFMDRVEIETAEVMRNDPNLRAYANWAQANPLMSEDEHGNLTWQNYWDDPWNMTFKTVAEIGPSLAAAMTPGVAFKLGGAALKTTSLVSGLSKAKSLQAISTGANWAGDAAFVASNYLSMPMMMAMEGGSYHKEIVNDLMSEGYSYEDIASLAQNGMFAYSVVSGAVLEPLQLNSVLSYMRKDKSMLREFTKGFVRKFAGRGSKGAKGAAFIMEQAMEGVVESLQYASQKILHEATSESLVDGESYLKSIMDGLSQTGTWKDIWNDPETWNSFGSAFIGFGGPKLASASIGSTYRAFKPKNDTIVTPDGDVINVGSKKEASAISALINNSANGSFEYEGPESIINNDALGFKLLLRQQGAFGSMSEGGKGKNFAGILHKQYDARKHGELGVIGKILLTYGKSKGGNIGEMLTQAYKHYIKKDPSGKLIEDLFKEAGLEDADAITEVKSWIGRKIKISMKEDLLKRARKLGVSSPKTIEKISNIVDNIDNIKALDAKASDAKMAQLEAQLNKDLKSAEVKIESKLRESDRQLNTNQRKESAQAQAHMDQDEQQQSRAQAYQGRKKNQSKDNTKKQDVSPVANPIINTVKNTLKSKGGVQGITKALLKKSNTEINKAAKSIGLDVESLLKTGKPQDKAKAIQQIITSVKGTSGPSKAPSGTPIITEKQETSIKDKPKGTKKSDKKADDLSSEISEVRDIHKAIKKFAKDGGPKDDIGRIKGLRSRLKEIVGSQVKFMNILESDPEIGDLLSDINEILTTKEEGGDQTLAQLMDAYNEPTLVDPSEEIPDNELTDVESKIFEPIQTFFKQFGITINKSSETIEAFINLPGKMAAVDPNSLEGITESTAAYLSEMLAYSDNFYKVLKIVKETEYFKAELQKLPEDKRGFKGQRKVAKKIFYELLKAKFGKAFIETLGIKGDKDKSRWNKVIKWIKGQVKTVKQMVGESNWKKLNEVVEDVVSNTMAGKDFVRLTKREGYDRVNFQKAFNENPTAMWVYEKLITNAKLFLTGSIAYATQGTVYRKAGNLVHDLDMVSSMTIEEGDAWMLENFPNAVLAYDFDSNKGSDNTHTWIIPGPGFKVKNIKRRIIEGDTDVQGNKIISYEIVNETGYIVGTYKLEYDIGEGGKIEDEREVKTGEEGILVDFFTEYDGKDERKTIRHKYIDSKGEVQEVELSHFEKPFEAKLNYSRYKDIIDYNRFIPYSGREKFLDAAIQEASVLEKIVLEDIQPQSITDYTSNDALDAGESLEKTEADQIINQIDDPLADNSEGSKIISEDMSNELNEKKKNCREDII
tara:strand:+ start:13636 stop:18198 length:4563 start_codon:yes stop_codon:yes gene_type:complete